MLDTWIQQLLDLLSLPHFGLSSVFIVSFISATLLPLGSEPVVYGMVKLRPDLFWETVAVATVGNTLGGIVDYWMGRGAEWALERRLKLDAHGLPIEGDVAVGKTPGKWHQRATNWLERWGPIGCLMAWLPGIGDPLCAVAGWLRLPFWPCVFWMTIGKCLRYVAMTAGLVWMF
jgi:membrane protein YqaA with SNARE-associated domain